MNREKGNILDLSFQIIFHYCKYSELIGCMSGLMYLANFRYINFRSYPFICHWWDCSCLNVLTLCAHHVTQGDYHGFANFSLIMGSLGRFTSSSCSVESAWPGALPHLASPRVRSPASRHRSGIRALWTSARPSADVERQMGACWMRLLWSQQTVQFTKNWFLVLSLSPSR